MRYPVLEVEARVEPFENGRGFSLRVLRAGKPRYILDFGFNSGRPLNSWQPLQEEVEPREYNSAQLTGIIRERERS